MTYIVTGVSSAKDKKMLWVSTLPQLMERLPKILWTRVMEKCTDKSAHDFLCPNPSYFTNLNQKTNGNSNETCEESQQRLGLGVGTVKPLKTV